MEEKIVDLIKSMRLSKDQTQKEFSKIAGMTISTYNLKETKKKPFKMNEIFNIFNFLDIFLQIENKIINNNYELIRTVIIFRNEKSMTQDYIRQQVDI